MSRLLALIDNQLAQLRVAAATLCVSSRGAFMRDVAAELGRHPEPTTDEQLTQAISAAIGVTPTTHVFLYDGAEQPTTEEKAT